MLPRKETVEFNGDHGTEPMEIRHKWDDCWELWQNDRGTDTQDLIHIEKEDMKDFVFAVVRATSDIPDNVACPFCGGYVRGHQFIGTDYCSVNRVFKEG